MNGQIKSVAERMYVVATSEDQNGEMNPPGVVVPSQMLDEAKAMFGKAVKEQVQGRVVASLSELPLDSQPFM